MKRTLVIVDSLTLTHNNMIYGHFSKVAQQLYAILANDFEVKVVGGSTYENYFVEEQVDILPYRTYYEEYCTGNTFQRLRSKLKSTINIIVTLRKNYDYLIFQSCSQSILYLLLFFFKRKQCKVFLIKYFLDTTRTQKLLFYLIRHKISYVFTSIDKVGKSYGIPYLLIPDYFPMKDNSNNVPISVTIDFVIVGTVDNDKNLEDIIQCINTTKYSLKIAGNFKDKEYLDRIKKMVAGKNIIIQDMYLTDIEYKDMILQGKYVILPYKKSAYTDRSSGVLLDAIYNGKPVIASNLSVFRLVDEFELGYLYNESISEVFSYVNDGNYDNLVQNTMIFRNKMEEKKKELIQTILKV